MPPAPLRFIWVLLMIVPTSFASGQLIIAHRGASHDAPENTLSAFHLAWQQGADGIEGDFYLSSDGHIVCNHDKDTERTAGKKLVVSKSTLAELRALDVGSWKGKKWSGEKMPTLEEVLATVPQGKYIFIELKTGPKVVEPLKYALSKSPVHSEKTVIISFNKETITACSKQLPHIKTMWLTSYKEKKKLDGGKWTPSASSVISTLRKTGATSLGSKANMEHFDADFLAQLQEAGVPEFGVWTVDDAKVAKYYRSLGASAITTNRPAWLREQLGCESDGTSPSSGQ